jgi:hypothetical protein
MFSEGYNASEIVSGTKTKPATRVELVQDWEKRENKVSECKETKETWETLKGFSKIINTNRVIVLKRMILLRK